MEDIPICECATFWEAHHDECPVRREVESLRAELAKADGQINRCVDQNRYLERLLSEAARDVSIVTFLRCGGWEVLQNPKYWTPENKFFGAIAEAMAEVAMAGGEQGFYQTEGTEMTAKQTPLVDLLRIHADDIHSAHGHNKSSTLLSRAADRIDALEAERDRLASRLEVMATAIINAAGYQNYAAGSPYDTGWQDAVRWIKQYLHNAAVAAEGEAK